MKYNEYSKSLLDSVDKEGFEATMALAKMGDADAQSMSGTNYFYGLGVEPDWQAAFAWFNKAASTGNCSDAQYHLGKMYLDGAGVEQDSGIAIEWLGKAVKNNSPEAHYLLGNMYYTGFGVDKDKDTAIKWYIKSAKLGSNWAQNHLRNIGMGYKK